MSSVVYEHPDIYKAAAIIIHDRKLLVSRSKGKQVFITPGGKLEAGETAKQACVRELREEQGLVLMETDLTYFDTYYAIAADQATELTLRMDVFMVKARGLSFSPQSEIVENCLISTANLAEINVGSVIALDIMPVLVAQDLVD